MSAHLSSCKIDAIPALDALHTILNVAMKFRMNLLQNGSVLRIHVDTRFGVVVGGFIG